MSNKFTATATIIIHAPLSKVWQALVNPEIIKQYLFNTEVISEWKEGSSIIYKGEWQGKAFEDKGKILKIEPEKMLMSTHWSPLSGVPDTPENYHTVTYTLSPKGDSIEVTITQDNNSTEEEKEHSEQNWRTVLAGMKKLLEG
ncbi:MAG TPA: SRPBCC domain-containing protein [Anaerolineales bacterium]|nr:SRPBCC domain-containing protein [Anaerolineales bacterium]